MHIKNINKKASGLIEVVIATFIFVTVATALLNYQQTTFFTAYENYQNFKSNIISNSFISKLNIYVEDKDKQDKESIYVLYDEIDWNFTKTRCSYYEDFENDCINKDVSIKNLCDLEKNIYFDSKELACSLITISPNVKITTKTCDDNINFYCIYINNDGIVRSTKEDCFNSNNCINKRIIK